ncbi:hypothetical protein D3C71_1584860 [compost metagenome]
MPISWPVAAASAAVPAAPRSCRRKSKPVALPRDEMAGGTRVNTCASWMPINCFWKALKAMAPAESCFSLRSLKSFKVVNAIAAFRPLPLKLKPCTAMMFSTAGMLRKYSSTCSITSTVRLALAPVGSSMLLMT